jgi:hypothetical protein
MVRSVLSTVILTFPSIFFRHNAVPDTILNKRLNDQCRHHNGFDIQRFIYVECIVEFFAKAHAFKLGIISRDFQKALMRTGIMPTKAFLFPKQIKLFAILHCLPFSYFNDFRD